MHFPVFSDLSHGETRVLSLLSRTVVALEHLHLSHAAISPTIFTHIIIRRDI